MAAAQRYTDALPLRMRVRLREIDRRVEAKVGQLIEQHKHADGSFNLRDLKEPLTALYATASLPRIWATSSCEACFGGRPRRRQPDVQEAAEIRQANQDKL